MNEYIIELYFSNNVVSYGGALPYIHVIILNGGTFPDSALCLYKCICSLLPIYGIATVIPWTTTPSLTFFSEPLTVYEKNQK